MRCRHCKGAETTPMLMATIKSANIASPQVTNRTPVSMIGVRFTIFTERLVLIMFIPPQKDRI